MCQYLIVDGEPFRIGQGLPAGGSHETQTFQPLASGLVEFGPSAPFPAGREPLGRPSVVGPHGTVDPSEAQCLLDTVQVTQGTVILAAVEIDPAFLLLVVVGDEPFTETVTVGEVEGFHFRVYDV